jgi:hypothetical protein
VNAASADRPAPVVALEGPSAVGKTTLLAALARECGAAVVPELSAAMPPLAEPTRWFIDQSAALWRQARAAGEGAPFAVLDGDPFKSLWYNWIYAGEGWADVAVTEPLFRARIERGTLAFPDLYVILTATEEELRERRAGDATRQRRRFEKHLRMLHPQRRYFAALQAADPARVVFLDTSDPATLVPRVLESVRALPPAPPNSLLLLSHITAWLRTNPDAGADG